MGNSQPPGYELTIQQLCKSYGDTTIVNHIDLTIAQGEFFAILGPSGCGKTTTLRMIAGLEQPTSGAIYLGSDNITHQPPYRRNVNTVFQNYALFPHMSVADNVAFGLRRRGIKDVDKPVREMLEMIQLPHIAQRKPAQLSGGQQQRVAIARALINEPAVLLLDEPLGALDMKLRHEMQNELKRIQTHVGISFIHVTHDQEEALTLADRVAVMNKGVIEQLADPYTLYNNPHTTFVANFLGKTNLLPATHHNGYAQLGNSRAQVSPRQVHTTDTTVLMGIRPEKIQIAAEHAAATTDFIIQGVVKCTNFTGASTHYTIDCPLVSTSMQVVKQNDGGTFYERGENVQLGWDARAVFLLARQPLPESDQPARKV